MARQNIAAMARANGVNPATAHGRISKGWSTEAATSTPARKYHRPKPRYAHGEKAAAVWAYLVADPLARPVDVANATGVSYGYVHKLMSKVGTPREVFEAEAKSVEPLVAEAKVMEPDEGHGLRNAFIVAGIVAVVIALIAYAQ